jgi:uncharacterized protein
MELTIFDRNDRSYVEELIGEPDELEIGSDEYSLDEPVRVVCRMRRDGEFLRVDGEADAGLSVQCDRCVEPFVMYVSGSFSLLVKRLAFDEPVPERNDDDETSGDEDICFVDHNAKSIDIAPYVRDAVILNVPMKILCSEDCRGLCPVCGNNLNESSCSCDVARNDPRWGSLPGLIENDTKD